MWNDWMNALIDKKSEVEISEKVCNNLGQLW